MAPFVFKDAKIYLDGNDLSGDHNSISIGVKVDPVQFTAFGANSRTYQAGLCDIDVNGTGFIDFGAGQPDDVYFAELASTGVFSLSPDGGNDGERAYTTQSLLTNYSPFPNTVGDAASFNITGKGRGQWVAGTILEDGSAAVSSSSNGTAFQIAGGVAADEYLYGALHVIAATGSPTLDVIIQSDTVGFPSATNRITFTQATGTGAEWGTRVAGAITDDYFRVNYTFGGTGDITFVCIVGVGR